ncbi:PTS glucose transporter subunit IIA [Streptococcus merionis]|uniref:PTS sugar transporter subunit IIA n=1 Tax=Streptococcus merionis TaxID=400065 RepID=UPI0026EE2D14|nr:PTS glucose transporter subunit IIA [Streptococcus merionis]
MFKIFQKKTNNEIVSPVTGKMIPLEDVPDKVFASKMMGDGVAFEIADDTVCSPVDGKISLIPDSKHAVGIVSDNGVEILVHIGLDTVNLQGKGFESLVKPGDKVSKGTPVVKVDRQTLTSQGVILTTPMIVTNGSEFQLSINDLDTVKAGETVVLECTKK